MIYLLKKEKKYCFVPAKGTFHLSTDFYITVKDKDKEALFNVAYNVTDNISSRAILQHNNYIFNRYLPVFISLAQPILCERQQGSC